MSEKSSNASTYILNPIGTVQRTENGVNLLLEPACRPGLASLGEFSHVIVLWWVHGFDNEEFRNKLQCKPPYAGDHLTGVFACRAEYRPNPIALTPCKILSVDEEKGIVRVVNIDAVDGSPLLDLKAYFPVLDRIREAHIPAWLSGWPEWQPEEGIGLEP
ncbi:MAG: SAM-dependent methyltransferase [Anaerolineales bacterium]|nr:SAM-dependent methyltransferase [Anaerolineales bacterium]